LIHTDQTGFIKGRYIREIQDICDLLEQTKIDKSSGGLLLIGFRYAFDTLEGLIIHNALETQYSFGISSGGGLRFSIKVLKAQFLYNGYASKWKIPSRG